MAGFDDPVSRYGSLNASTFSSEIEAAAWEKYRADPDANRRDEVFGLYVRYAQSAARRRYRARSGNDVELPDLLQLAYAGLLEAIDGFDVTRGVPFLAFARRRILGSMANGTAQASELRHQLSFRQRVRRERVAALAGAADLSDQNPGTLDDLADIAASLAIGFMLEDAPLFLAQDRADTKPDAYQSLAWKQAVVGLARELDRLPERERLILRRHYLDGLAFDQIATLLGVSRARISQLHTAALASLRKRLPKPDDFRT